MENLIINAIQFELSYNGMSPFKISDLSKLTGITVAHIKTIMKTPGGGSNEEGCYYSSGGYPYFIGNNKMDKVDKYLTLPFLALEYKQYLFDNKVELQQNDYKLNRKKHGELYTKRWYRAKKILRDNGIDYKSIYDPSDKIKYQIDKNVIYNKISNTFTYFSDPDAKSRYENLKEIEDLKLYSFFIKKIKGMRGGAIKRKLTFDISAEDLIQVFHKQNGMCYYSHLPLATDTVKRSSISDRTETALSVDRLDSSKGYIIDNIVLCLNVYNTMKSNMTSEDFIYYIKMFKH